MASGRPLLTRPVGGHEDNWVKSTAGGTGIVAFGALFDGKIESQHVKAVVQELLNSHTILRVQIIETARGETWFDATKSCEAKDYVDDKPYWPSMEGLDETGIVIFPGYKHGSLALHKLVTEELNAFFVNTEEEPSLPLRVFRVLVHRHHSHDQHQTIIVLKLHSGALDLLSARNVAEEFLGKLNLAVEDRLQHPETSKCDELGLRPPIEKLIPKGKASKGLCQKVVDVLRYIANNSTKYALLPFDPNFSETSETRLQSNIVSVILNIHETMSLRDACTRENILRPAAALSAALLKTTAELKELKMKKLTMKKQDKFYMTIVMDCREYLERKLPKTALGNYSLGIPQDVKVSKEIQFWDLARQVHSSIEKDCSESKQFSEMSVLQYLYSQVMKHPNVISKSSLRTLLFNLFLDPPMKAQCLGLVGTIGPFSSIHFVGPCFCVVQPLVQETEQLVVSLVYPSPIFSQLQIFKILKSSISLLIESCKHANDPSLRASSSCF